MWIEQTGRGTGAACKDSMVMKPRPACLAVGQASRLPSGLRPPTAFTLIELLVVISIIALLVGILLPVLGSARKTSRLAACLSNVRQMTIATNAYMVENRQVTPAAFYNNSTGGMTTNTPRNKGAVVGTVTNPGAIGGTVWDSSAGALRFHLNGDPEKIFRCPSAPDSNDDAWKYTGSNPISGTAATDEFKPNYFYMYTAHWINNAPGPNFYLGNMWATRNVANVNADGINNQSLSEVVAWVDESTSHHTSSSDIYTHTAAGKTEDDLDNFGYLDGHAETKQFNQLRGYFEALHDPIPQTQWELDFTQRPNWALRFDLPPEI